MEIFAFDEELQCIDNRILWSSAITLAKKLPKQDQQPVLKHIFNVWVNNNGATRGMLESYAKEFPEIKPFVKAMCRELGYMPQRTPCM